MLVICDGDRMEIVVLAILCVCVWVSLPIKHDGASYGAADALGDVDIFDDDAGSD